MKLTQLRALVATIEGRSVHEAARALHRTQPAVSVALAALEASVGVALFDRHPRGIMPTAAGRLLAERARRGLERLAAGAERAGLAVAAVRRLYQQSSDAQLRALSALVETRGFSAAARAVGVSQSSIHRSVNELSRLIGVRLWARSGRNTEPTDEAQAIAIGIDLAASELRLGREELREAVGRLDGQLLIGALPTARASWLPRSLVSTLQLFPQASVSIMDGPYDEQLSALRHGRIDLIMGALRDRPAPPPDIEQQAIFEDTLSIVVRGDHPLARRCGHERARLTARQLAGLYWLLPPVGTPPRTCFQAFLKARGLPQPLAAIDCNSFLTIRSLLLATDYAAVVPTDLIATDVFQPCLRTLGPPLRGSSHPVGWAIRSGFRPTQLQQRFLEIARAKANTRDPCSAAAPADPGLESPARDPTVPSIPACASARTRARLP